MISSTEVHTNAFSRSELAELTEYFANAPVSSVEPNGNVNKNLDYHVPGSVANRIIQPKIQEFLGEHKFASGAYKECCVPYSLHYDNATMHNANHPVVDQSVEKNRAILLPLVEGPEFATITFNVFSDSVFERGSLIDDRYLGANNNLNPEHFTHMSEPMQAQCVRLPVDTVYQWRIGDMLFWDRSQLHCSSNFRSFNDKLIKKFIVIFVA